MSPLSTTAQELGPHACPPIGNRSTHESSCQVCQQDMPCVRHREIGGDRAARRLRRAQRSSPLSGLRSADADHPIHQSVEGDRCSQNCKQVAQQVVDSPAQLEKRYQGLQARKREEVLIAAANFYLPIHAIPELFGCIYRCRLSLGLFGINPGLNC
jgi:hypothetical protein